MVGLGALLWLLGEALVAAWRLREDPLRPHASEALLGGIVAGVVALQFHFVTLDSAPLLAMLMGLAIGRASARDSVAELAPDRAARGAQATRVVAATATLVLAVGCVAAAGLVLADRNLATGFRLVAEKQPWKQARSPLVSAQTLAPWEPAMGWALGRAATQWMSATQQTSAFADGSGAMRSTLARLPLDPLAVAQNTDVHLVYGLAAKDRSALETALASAGHAIELDPQNGYRWEAKGTAIAALGETRGAVDSYLTAVRFSPGDAQAWANLARMYDRLGQSAAAEQARRRADAATAASAGAGLQ